MATIRYYNLLDPTLVGVSYIDISATRMVFASNGVITTVTGTFVVAGDAVLGGTVTGFSIEQNGKPLLTFEGLNIPATALYAAAARNDGDAVSSMIFGGNDEVWGSVNGEVVVGFGGADAIIALDGDDTVVGGDGNDDVNGNVGQDIVYGEAGADWVRGGKDNDILFGGDGDDPHVNGNLGDDLVFGEAGNDTVYGGQGSDSLSGGDGNDLLSGDLGDDALLGGAGADRFVLRQGGGSDVVGDFNAAQGDRIQLSAGAYYVASVVGGQLVYDLGGGDKIILFAIADASQASSWVVFA